MSENERIANGCLFKVVFMFHLPLNDGIEQRLIIIILML